MQINIIFKNQTKKKISGAKCPGCISLDKMRLVQAQLYLYQTRRWTTRPEHAKPGPNRGMHCSTTTSYYYSLPFLTGTQQIHSMRHCTRTRLNNTAPCCAEPGQDFAQLYIVSQYPRIIALHYSLPTRDRTERDWAAPQLDASAPYCTPTQQHNTTRDWTLPNLRNTT